MFDKKEWTKERGEKMLDWTDSNKVWDISENLIELSKRYRDARTNHAKALYEFNVILASSMSELRQKKSNVGYETAKIMLLEICNDDVRKIYQSTIRYEAEYKSLERMLEAQNSQLMLAMSLAKNQTKQGG